jgi:hypothetical protein
VRVTGVRDWRFNQRLEDIEFLLRLSSADGAASTVSWQVLYNISHSQQWAELQRFLLPKLVQLRALARSQGVAGSASGAAPQQGALFRPTPHAFKPWRRDYISDWRHSRARDQVCVCVFGGRTRAVGCGSAAAGAVPCNTHLADTPPRAARAAAVPGAAR